MRRLSVLTSPLRVAACRSLFAAQAISGMGDWAGRLALAAVVYGRSESASWAAAVTVAALLPWLGPGQLLATFADRFGRVSVMVGADLARAALFALMLIPQPTWMLLVLAFLAGACVPPFAGSRGSALVEITPPDRYPAALALYGVLSQTEILIGYVAGGLVIAAFGADVALAVNACTFLVSAWLLRSLASTPAASRNERSMIGWSGVRAGIAVWRVDPICRRALALFVGVSMFMVLPEALVVPFTAELDVSSHLVGVFAALGAVGSIVGMMVVPTAATHQTLLRVTALRATLLASVSGVLFALGSRPAVAAAAFIVSGAVDAVSVPTNQIVGERLPVSGRAAAMSVAGGVQYAAQAGAIAVAGLAATVWSPRPTLMVAMFLASAASAWALLRPRVDDHRFDLVPTHSA